MNTDRLFALIAFVLLSAGSLARGADASKTDIPGSVAHVIDAYGGEKALRAVHGYRAAGNQWASQLDQPIHAERWFARPDRLRLDLDYPDHHELRITDGARGWAGSSAADLAPANPMKLQAMRLQSARLDLPLRLLENLDKIEARDADDTGRIVLRLPIDDALYIDYHIDPKTWLITRVVTGMTAPAMEFSADYAGFKKVDGVLVPYHEVTFAGTTQTSKFQMTSFEWDPKDLEASLAHDAPGH
jgi:hypothetical protein